jgi:hypothetical protein
MFEAAEEGDDIAKQILNEWAEDVAEGIAQIQVMYLGNPFCYIFCPLIQYLFCNIITFFSCFKQYWHISWIFIVSSN